MEGLERQARKRGLGPVARRSPFVKDSSVQVIEEIMTCEVYFCLCSHLALSLCYFTSQCFLASSNNFAVISLSF